QLLRLVDGCAMSGGLVIHASRMIRVAAGGAAVAVALAGCLESATLPLSAGMGPDPALPPPNPTLIPTVHIAPAKGWPDAGTPVAAPGPTVSPFATGLDHPR